MEGQALLTVGEMELARFCLEKKAEFSISEQVAVGLCEYRQQKPGS